MKPGSYYAPFATPIERSVAARKDAMLMLLPWAIVVAFALAFENGILFLASIPAVLLFAFAHQIITLGLWGQTVGMRMSHLKVVRAEDGGPIGFRRAIRRAAWGLVAVAPLSYQWHPFKVHKKEPRMIHDREARTALIRVP